MRSLTLLALCALLGCAAAMGDRHERRWKNPCRHEKNGIAVATGGCSNEFVPCWNHRPAAIQTCPVGLVYNAWTQACVYPGAVGTHGCKCSKAYRNDKPMAVACEVCRYHQKVGFFPFPGDHELFVECTMQGPVVRSCNGGRFSKHRKGCV